jgi:beta-N-acetylhexosaminidase
MDLPKAIGRLFSVAARGALTDEVVRHVRDNHAGGVIWFQSTTDEVARANAHLQNIATEPLLISADLEAGMGMRFTDATWWPPAMALGSIGDVELAEEQARVTAREALAIGVNHILAPVCDVNVDPDNPVINTRSFGEDPHEVARFVTAYVRGIQSEGGLATAKHFPGHGDTHVDSHRALPVLDVSRERLEAIELSPFRAAIEAGVASVMIGHLAVPALDPTPVPVRAAFENVWGTETHEVTRGGTMPATLSRPVIDLLRKNLGFDGLILTDAMDMGGLAAHFDPGEAAVRAIEVGVDQILYSPDTDAAIAAVMAAVQSGRLQMTRVQEACERIHAAAARCHPRSHNLSSRAKSRDLGGRGDRHVQPIPSRPGPSTPLGMTSGIRNPHESLRTPSRTPPTALDIARRSIRIVRDASGLIPLDSTSFAVRVFSDEPLDHAIEALNAGCAIGEAEVIVMLLNTRPKSGAGRIAIPDEAKRIAVTFPHKTIAISFGSPYVLRELGDVSTFVCAWGIQPVLQLAAIEALRQKK